MSDDLNGTKSSNLQFEFPEGEVSETDMAPVMDVLTQGEEEAAQAEQLMAAQVTPEQIAVFLREFYRVEGYLSYPELWDRDDSFFLEIATGITPQVNQWCMMFPVLGQAIHTVSAAGAWGRLVWDQGWTWYRVYAIKQEEKQTKEEGTDGQQPTAIVARPVPSGSSKQPPNPYVIDYPNFSSR